MVAEDPDSDEDNEVDCCFCDSLSNISDETYVTHKILSFRISPMKNFISHNKPPPLNKHPSRISPLIKFQN